MVIGGFVDANKLIKSIDVILKGLKNKSEMTIANCNSRSFMKRMHDDRRRVFAEDRREQELESTKPEARSK